MAEAVKDNPISAFMKKRAADKPPKEEKRSRKEERERFKKRLATLTPMSRSTLKGKEPLTQCGLYAVRCWYSDFAS